MLLEDKVAIISGVGPGLGRQLAFAFAREGASLVLGARSESRLEAVQADVAALGAQVRCAPTDITDQHQCNHLVQVAREGFGRVDVLVNNAAAAPARQPFADVDLDAWREVMEVTLFGSLQMTGAVIPAMPEGGGSIVFVNSMIIRKVLAREGDYATAKGALLTAAQVLARELGPQQIRVNSIVPGWLWGPSVEAYCAEAAARTGTSVQDQYDEIVARIPLGEIPSDADCANAAVFFASDLSSAVTGQALDVNGGEVCH